MRITREDLVVLSFPGPDRSILMDDLRTGKAVSRRYRNRRIGEFLKELDLTEGRSTGISKILKVMAANCSPATEFESDEDRSFFLIRLPVHERAARGGPPQVPGQCEAHDEAHEPMNDIERRILERCSDQPKSTHNLLQALGYETRTGNFKRALARMLNVGCLEMTIPAKPRSKKQEYRLTDKGRRWLEDNDKSP